MDTETFLNWQTLRFCHLFKKLKVRWVILKGSSRARGLPPPPPTVHVSQHMPFLPGRKCLWHHLLLRYFVQNLRPNPRGLSSRYGTCVSKIKTAHHKKISPFPRGIWTKRQKCPVVQVSVLILVLICISRTSDKECSR